jgi:hypothetical protein
VSAIGLQKMSIVFLASLSACSNQIEPCEDKLVVLEGTGYIEVVSQWDACVARRASQLALEGVADAALISQSLEKCLGYKDFYATAYQEMTPGASSAEAEDMAASYLATLKEIASDEARRARELGCVAK